MALLSEGVSRPGIDPRIWVSYGVLTSEPYIETVEGRQDVLVNVTLLPCGMEETARVGAIYAGNGFGFYTPLHVDDEVLVVSPSGDPDEGLVIAQRLWSPADPPPASLSANPNDVTLVVEPGRNLRMSVQGAGNVVIDAADGQVKLGSDSATKGVARLDDAVQVTITPADFAAAGLANSGGPVVATTPITVTGKVTAASQKVVAS